jgi:SAM-dependent methyltransferase
LYERYLVPMIFAPYAADLARRAAATRPKRVLEIAAGTGVVTRALAAALPDAGIVATDLNPAMLEQARAIGTARPVEWRQADAIGDALAAVFPDDPPRFRARTPLGYHDAATIERDLVTAAFALPPRIETHAFSSPAQSARIVAVAYCQGTPWRNEIEARDASMLDAATDAAEMEIARRFGTGTVDGKIQAIVVKIEA